MKKEDIIIKSLDQLNRRFDSLEGRFDGLEDRFDSLEGRFDGLDHQVDGLAQNVAKHDDQIDLVVRSLLELHDKVDELVPLPARLDAFEDRITGILDGHSGTLERLDQERLVGIHRFERIEGDIMAIKGHLGMRAAAV